MGIHSASLTPITENTIRAIWSAHKLATVTRITMPPGGVRNLCFFINDAFVVRFNTQDRGSAKFRSEQLAYELLAQHGLPVPTVLAVDESHSLTPHDFIITTRLPGQTLAQSWQRLPQDQLHTLIYETGQCLARVHACTFPAFGKLRSLSYTSWASYIYDYIERYLRLADEMHLLDGNLGINIERARDHAMIDFETVTQPSLIHCDFHYENTLQLNGHITGILDFEWALAGDPSYDFMIAEVRERMVPNSEAAFNAGYQSIRSFIPGHERRVRWYQLFLQLEEAVTYQRMDDSNNAVIALQRLRQLVEEVEQ